MRPALPVKALTADLHEARKLASTPPFWPDGAALARHAPIETALEIQFHGVENLIRALNAITGARGRRWRRPRR